MASVTSAAPRPPLTRADKVRAILCPDAPAAPARTHYLAEETHAFDPQRFVQRFPAVYAWVKAILSPTLTLHRWRSQVPDPASGIVINLGAGTTCLDKNLINVDFVAFPHIDIVADFSQSLPIRSESVDAVLSISVFEHLENAPHTVAEVTRILKPGGIFYLATPFLYPFHGAPSDFTRWTLPGLRTLLGDAFEIRASGGRGGPLGVAILALAHLVAQLCCFGSAHVYSLVNFACLGLLAPLKLPDLLLERLPFSTTLCPGLYVTARKREIAAGEPR